MPFELRNRLLKFSINVLRTGPAFRFSSSEIIVRSLIFFTMNRMLSSSFCARIQLAVEYGWSISSVGTVAIVRPIVSPEGPSPTWFEVVEQFLGFWRWNLIIRRENGFVIHHKFARFSSLSTLRNFNFSNLQHTMSFRVIFHRLDIRTLLTGNMFVYKLSSRMLTFDCIG